MNELEALALALEIEKAELRFYIDIPKISKKDKKSVRAKVLRFFPHSLSLFRYRS